MGWFKKSIIDIALEEDIGTGDITTEAVVSDDHVSTAQIVIKENGVVAGLKFLKKMFPGCSVTLFAKDGDTVKKGWVAAEVKGETRVILSHERVALNFLGRLCGIATITKQFVGVARGAIILDTRKTMPGMRKMDKYAVRMGGGVNHRFGLYDMVLIKDNHIAAAGSITKAMQKVKLKTDKKVEIEVGSLKELEEALSLWPDMIMLDNMSISDMKKAVKMVDGKILLEASGGITLDNVGKVASTGVDFISVGAITHSVTSLDVSLDIVGDKI
jgi:nicotinate-nucleotide pyrophosphorylase (carboxylating)